MYKILFLLYFQMYHIPKFFSPLSLQRGDMYKKLIPDYLHHKSIPHAQSDCPKCHRKWRTPASPPRHKYNRDTTVELPRHHNHSFFCYFQKNLWYSLIQFLQFWPQFFRFLLFSPALHSKLPKQFHSLPDGYKRLRLQDKQTHLFHPSPRPDDNLPKPASNSPPFHQTEYKHHHAPDKRPPALDRSQ